MNTRLKELRSKPLALLTVEEFLELQQTHLTPQAASLIYLIS